MPTPAAIPTAKTAAVLLALVVAVAGAAVAQPPAAPSHPVVEQLHGVTVTDPYRNLENLTSTETKTWLRAEGDYAADQLARIEGRAAMVERIEALQRASGDAVREVVRMPGGRIYFLKRKAGENQFKLVMRQGVSGTERILVDPARETKATGTPYAVNYFVPSWDGKTLAYGMSAGGSEDTSLYLLDIESGRPIGKPIPRVHDGLVHWAPDSRSLSYNQLRALPAGAAESETYLDTTVYLLDLGHRSAPPRPLFGPLVDPALKLARLDVAEVLFAPDSGFMIARTTDTSVPEGRLFVARVADLGKAKIDWRPLATAADKITHIQLRGDTLYLRSYAGAPRGRVLALPLRDPVLADAVEVVAEPKTGVLVDFTLGRDAVYIEVHEGFNTRVREHRSGGPAEGTDVATALPGSTYVVDDPAHAERDVWVAMQSWTEPPKILAIAASGDVHDTGLLATLRPPGTPELEVSEVLVPSHDGAQVPLAILRKKGLPRDGSSPTLLIGYGAYAFSIDAFFDPTSAAWLERGGVLAYANVRGSGAFGDSWHRAGFKATKANTWKDGIACASYLIAQRYTTPKTLGIWGTSAGGIFVGRAVTSAPELFAAAIFDVGVMDTVRSEESANGITNISEFGSYKNASEFPALLEMSTYQHIEDRTAYPAVLLIHGLNDPRVDVWHSAKTAARLQAATSSGKPILLRLDRDAGHGIGSTARQRDEKLADIYSFLLWQFGRVGQAH
jgi:prolyl oligopeptidase